jgi:hypothetical protein
MLLPDPPQLHGTHNHLEHYRVAERLGVIAASGDAHAPQASTLLRLLLEEREFEATVYASLFDRSFVDAKGRRARRSNANTRNYKRRITVTAGMTSPSSLSVRISLRRYGGYGILRTSSGTFVQVIAPRAAISIARRLRRLSIGSGAPV